MAYRPGRSQNLERDREPRWITPETNARCENVLTKHIGLLNDAEAEALRLVTAAFQTNRAIVKQELDRAMSILGTFVPRHDNRRAHNKSYHS